MRRIPLNSITPSGANPASIVLGPTPDNPGGDWSAVFQGRFYRDAMGATQPWYTSPTAAPSGYALIQATTFTLVAPGANYAGRYTVYTQPDGAGLTSSVAGGGVTTVRVDEAVSTLSRPVNVSTDYVTNVSTYYITVTGEPAIVVPPDTILETRPVELPGRSFSGWGEVFLQNLAKQTQNFAGSAAPSNPFVGQPWYNTSNGEFRIWSGSSWNLLNGTVFSTANSFRHTQATAATTWTVNHNLGVASPFIVHASFFVDVGGGVIKPILPADMTYVSANQFTVTFSTAYSGFALVRP